MEEHVLIVDDEPGLCSVLKIYLMDMGYLVQTAANGKEAVSLMENSFFDIVLTDIRMPGMSGIALLHHIKQHHSDTEVIMITGHDDIKAAIESLKADAVDFITKPIDRDILEIALKRADDRISARKQIEKYTRKLETMVQEKTSHLADIGLHISTVSHSLKQVLTGIDGGTYLIESGLKNKKFDRLSEGWDMVREKLFKTRTMVLEILQHAKKRPLKKAQACVQELSEEICRNIQSQLDHHHINFITDLPNQSECFHIDKIVIFNALTAILENAVDALKESSADKPEIRFTVTCSDDCACFLIRDNGKGIAKENQKKIFDMFYSKKGSKGTGLGLFIASKSIREHGGSITVASEEGVFTEFTVTLPRSE